MYVDKVLTDIKAVQTLSRLNRAHPQKRDVFVLDFANDTEVIRQSFARYYKTTILSDETDPNKLHDLVAELESHQVYTDENIQSIVELYLKGAERNALDPVLDACADIYKSDLDLDAQIAFKSAAKAFVRTYGFLGAILPYGSAAWEKLSIFLTLLIPKLPSPQGEDLAEGILQSIDLDSYRAEKQAAIALKLADEDAEVAPVPVSTNSGNPAPEMDKLTNILNRFNELFGNIAWEDADNVRRQIAELPAMVAKDEVYQNAMKNSDKQNARLESERALNAVMFKIMRDNMELFKQFNDSPDFKKWLSDMVFDVTYDPSGNHKRIATAK